MRFSKYEDVLSLTLGRHFPIIRGKSSYLHRLAVSIQDIASQPKGKLPLVDKSALYQSLGKHTHTPWEYAS